ncbi:DUF397 domain-containing protein [Kitasatospora sp. RB6PN24]|uniref:DUF397 domain-containing protein n=1 Tax=Kitasatospora humi TaxID=2893891 RepID=UPI001E3F0B73|nr:DUF397 domain-containing protein [Kitasatospora humi]MCC9308399.1 DUF397 domain-containing protein [Kitasatospora humi]
MSIDEFGWASPEMTWSKSSYSSGAGGECVEVATSNATVHIRDSKDPVGPRLTVDPAAWASFVRLAANQASPLA